MILLSDVIRTLENIAPPELAEEWDNTGLLLGDSTRPVSRILTCLTLTPDIAEEAASGGFDLIVSHHPIMFKPLQRITVEDSQGKMLLRLIQAGIAVYSPHTSYDNSLLGINQQWAEQFQLKEIRPLRIKTGDLPAIHGSGRCGDLPQPTSLEILLSAWGERISGLTWVGERNRQVFRIGIACGAAAEFLEDACRSGCDLFVTGEARFHDMLKSRDLGIAMVLLGHYASERGGIEVLARQIQERHPVCHVQASQMETDPLQWK